MVESFFNLAKKIDFGSLNEQDESREQTPKKTVENNSSSQEGRSENVRN